MKKLVVTTMGKFNPPTVGHEKLIRALQRRAGSDGDVVVFVSEKMDAQKSPLTADERINILKRVFPSVEFKKAPSDLVSAAAEHGFRAGQFAIPAYFIGKYETCVYMAGGDRNEEVANRKSPKLADYYKDRDIEVIEDVDNSTDRTGGDFASSISSTKMREFAANGDFESFAKGMDFSHKPAGFDAVIKDTFDRVQKFMHAPKPAPKTKRAPRKKTIAESIAELNLLSFSDFVNTVELFNEDTKCINNVLNEDINAHSTHIEELCFTKGLVGLTQAVHGMKFITREIGKSSGFVSKKIDGRMSVFMCRDKSGEFFVASKNIFTKTPRLYYTPESIDEGEDKGDKAQVLKECLKYLKRVCPKGKNFAIQCDLLFTEDTKKSVVVKDTGEERWIFHPNTIAYTVNKNTPLGKIIGRAKLGVAIHTYYTWDGEDPKSLNATKFGINIKDHIVTDPNDASMGDVFVMDTISDIKPKKELAFNEQQFNEVIETLDKALKIGQTVDWGILTSNSDASEILCTFINTFIRKNIIMPEPVKRVEEFLTYISTKHQEALYTKDKKTGEMKLKGTKGQATANAKFAALEALNANKKDLVDLFTVFDLLTTSKLIIIKKLNSLSTFNNFVIAKNGDMINTGEEGYVISNVDDGSALARGCKLVDRYEFSHNNFSDDLIKGWSR